MIIPYDQEGIDVAQFVKYIKGLHSLCQNEIEVYEDYCCNHQVTSTRNLVAQVTMPHQFGEPHFRNVEDPPPPAPYSNENNLVYHNPNPLARNIRVDTIFLFLPTPPALNLIYLWGYGEFPTVHLQEARSFKLLGVTV